MIGCNVSLYIRIPGLTCSRINRDRTREAGVTVRRFTIASTSLSGERVMRDRGGGGGEREEWITERTGGLD